MKISFIGDSAGASIILSTLLHFSGLPHPNISPAQLPTGRKFRRYALLPPVSPYPSDTRSIQDLNTKDVMNKKMYTDLWAVTENNCKARVTVPNN
jgi:hypothetical protein